MPTNRMEAFSDGVIAILITVMVLELRIPHGTSWEALRGSLPTLLTYVLSFVYLGIYWNNHHHMLALTQEVAGLVLWANLHLLFWLSLIPFATGWMGENHFAPVPTAAYGVVLLAAAVAYYVLQATIIRRQGPGSPLAVAVGRDLKGKLSPALYATSIAFSFAQRWLAVAGYVLVALMWLVPDRRVERTIAARGGTEASAQPPGSTLT
jgi:TMEM175 potassium channel family protein